MALFYFMHHGAVPCALTETASMEDSGFVIIAVSPYSRAYPCTRASQYRLELPHIFRR